MERPKTDNFRGSSLIEVLVAVAIVAVLAMSIASLLSGMSREQSYMQTKVDSLTAQSLILMDFINNRGNCNINLQQRDFNPASPQTVLTFTELKVPDGGGAFTALVRTPASTVPGGVVVNQIQIENVAANPGPETWTGQMVIKFNSPIRALKDYTFPLSFTVDPATDKITGCGAGLNNPYFTLTALNQVQSYTANSCPGGFIINPTLTVFRQDGNTGDLWTGILVPMVDGQPRWDLTAEFGSKKGGDHGHGWDYFASGVSRRSYLPLLSNTAHTFSMKFYIGNRGGANFTVTPDTSQYISPPQEVLSNPYIVFGYAQMLIECISQ